MVKSADGREEKDGDTDVCSAGGGDSFGWCSLMKQQEVMREILPEYLLKKVRMMKKVKKKVMNVDELEQTLQPYKRRTKAASRIAPSSNETRESSVPLTSCLSLKDTLHPFF